MAYPDPDGRREFTAAAVNNTVFYGNERSMLEAFKRIDITKINSASAKVI
jgi:hypothetical protein